MKTNYSKYLVIFALVLSTGLHAQDYISAIKKHLNQDVSRYAKQTEDVKDFVITKEVPSKNGIVHVYAAQHFNGVPIRNAMVNTAFKGKEIIYLSASLESDIATRATVSVPSLTPLQAAKSAATKLGLGGSNFKIESAISTQEFLLTSGGVSHNAVPVQLVYAVTKDGTLKLAWDLSIHTLDDKHWWSVRIDASTGNIIDKNDWILTCTFEGHNHQGNSRRVGSNNSSVLPLYKENTTPTEIMTGEQYNVYAMPLESPNHGDRSIVVNPQNEVASPFGWHDTDGVEGAEFTTTRGNNVWAQEDTNGDDLGGNQTEGGSDLSFDFPIDFTRDATASTDAAVTNLFYWNNIIHDVFYQYGFDEASGNFQQNNYNGSAGAGDAVFADAQDGSGIDNATFGTPPDGNSGTMTMFLWNSTGEFGNFEVTSPASLAGNTGITIAAFARSNGQPNVSFFPSSEGEVLTASLVLVEDDNASEESDDALDACDTIINSDALPGQIAVVRRGTCNFVDKVASAQQAGAIGVVVVNNVADDIINLGGTSDLVNVPSGMISQAFGDPLIAALQAGEAITVGVSRPNFKDGDFDNGIIVHEYGHGISTRLTGGSNNSGCLDSNQQQEQMGEGWSDYFGLMLTMTEDDVATQGRGIGTFVINQPTDGLGIRPARYSTDNTVNSLTYADTNNTATISQPHGIGTVWASILWDMTWAFIEQYGYNSDIYNGTGGNNIALQIVVDGLKLQPCLPGFVDGRDALLAAVDINDAFTTVEERRDAKCLIYTAFATRGVGVNASQGSRLSRTDQVESMELPEGDDNFCNALSTSDASSSTFRVFPNPSNGSINISFRSNDGEGQVKIFDIKGSEVYSSAISLSGTITVDTPNLASGVYLLQVQSSRTVQTTKIIIE